MRKSRRILALVVALVMTVGMLPTSAFAAEPEEQEQGHVHTSECYEKQLICGLDEHTHGDECYTITEAPAPAEDNSESNESGSESSNESAEPQPAPEAGAEDSGDQGGETEADVDSGSESAEGGESESNAEPESASDSDTSSESSSVEETNIADEPAPLAAEPTKELTCGLEEHTHSEDCYELTLICGLEEDEEAKAPETNGGAAATEEPSEAVQAFLDAAAALPETVDEENFEQVQSLMEACQDAYDALEPEDLEREDVQAALVKMANLMGEVETLALVFPTEPVAKIGDVEYPMLALAVRKAAPGDTITLTADVTESVTVSQSVTIDLDGHTWTGRNDTTLIVTGGNDVAVTVKNGTMTVADGFDAGSAGSVIHAEKCDLTIENCTINGTAKRLVQVASTSAKIHPNVTLTIQDSEFSDASYAAVYAAVEGNIKDRSMKVDLSGSTFKDNARGLHCSVNNSIPKPRFDVDVSDCTFEGSKNLGAGISIANNKNNVDNFTVDVTNTKFLNGTGSALKMASYSDYATVNIVGGEISGNKVSYDSDSVIKVNGPFTMDGTTVVDNSGYLLMDLEYANAVSIKNATISNNESTSSDSRGTVYVVPNANATVDVGNSAFIENSGKTGGALYIKGTNLVANIAGSTFKKNTAKGSGGAIYLDNTGATTIADTTITGNIANGSPAKVMCFGNYGGGVYVANTTGTVTLSGTTRVYDNHTPNDTQVPGTNDGGSADIALYSTKVTSSTTAKNPANFTHATLVLDGETSFTAENGNKYTLTQFDRTLVNKNGYYWFSGSNYYWPMGYYTVVEEPVRVYLGSDEQHTSDKAIVTATLAEAVQAAKDNNQDTVYLCKGVSLDAEAAELLNNSGLTFARCEEHPNGSMFIVSGSVTLNGAHIDGKNYESDKALISVSGSNHLTIAGDTIIENGKNPNGNGGAIALSQAGLTMEGGTITGNSAKQGGGIYAYSNYNGAKLVFEGGTVSRNTSKDAGGGAFIGYIPSEFGVQGGRTVFTENTGFMGGGVYFVGQEHKVYRADFTKNTATRPTAGYWYHGGGIYIESGTNVVMQNVFVSGNKTNYPNAPECAFGICPTGEMHVLDCQGLLVANNAGNDIGFSRYTTAGGTNTENAGLKISKYALGGGQIEYRKKYGFLFGGSGKGELLTDEEYDTPFQIPMGGMLALNTDASEQTIRWAREMAESNGVVITGNKANGCGSGIMNNGSLIIGTDRIDMDVNKTWVSADLQEIAGDGADLPAQIIVNLVRVNKDGSYELVNSDTRPDAMVALNKDNGWSYTWKDLDPLAEWSVAEASVEGWKLWKVEQSGNYTPAAGDSFALTERPIVDETKTTEPAKYGHVQFDWSNEGYAITGLLKDAKDSIVENGVAVEMASDEYYLWKKEVNGGSASRSRVARAMRARAVSTEDGEYTLIATSGDVRDLINQIGATEGSVASASFGRVAKYLRNDNDKIIGYIVAYERADGKNVYIRWEAKDGGLVCTLVASSLSTAITNKESDEFKPVSFTKKTDGLKETDQKFTFDVEVTVNTSVTGEGGENITENTFVYYTVSSEPENSIHRVGNTTGMGTYKFTVTIEAGEKVTIHGLQVGDEYTITERPGEYDTYIDGEPNVKRTVSGTIEAQEGDEQKEISFEFFNRLASLTVTKKWVGSDVYPNSIQVQLLRNGEKLGEPKTLSADSDWSATWNQLRYYDENGEKYQYTVEETPVEGYAPTYGEAQWNGEKYQYTVKIANTRELGDLTINKKVKGLPGSIAVEKTYVFTVEAVGENLMKETANKTFGGVSFDENGKATVEIKVDGTNLQGSVTIQNLPTGSYKVTEQTEGVQQEYYTLVATGTQNAEVTQSGVSVSFTNTYDRDEKKENATLTIHKDLKDGDNNLSSDKTFRFRITGKTVYNEEIMPIEVEVIGGGNSETIKLMKGSYEIEELEPAKAEVPGYTWQRVEWPNGSNKVNLTNAANVTFTAVNHYTRNTGSLIIEKALAENAPEAAKTKEYTFEVTGPNGYQKTVVITGAGKEILENLPTGQYTVKEQDAGISGYSWKATVDGVETQEVTVEVKLDETAEATITNDYTPNRRPPEEPEEPDEPDEPDEPNTPEEPDEEIPDDETPLTPGPGPDPEVPTPDVPKEPEEVIELEEPEVPLADMPEEPEVEIPEEDVPLADVPKTGDDSNAQLWLALALASLCGMALVARKSDENTR